MQIKLKPNKKLFTIFLLINAAGYNYENNPKDINPSRNYFRKKISKLSLLDKNIKNFIKIIKNSSIASNNYIRLVNLVMINNKNIFDNSKKSKKIINLWAELKFDFNKIIKSESIQKLFNGYCNKLTKIKNYKKKDFHRELNKVLEFFNLPKNLDLNIIIHLNLLESYCRGTNYFTPQEQYISCSLDFDNQIDWKVVRHEFMHILLKKIFKNKLKNKRIIIPVNKNYKDDNIRVKFEENFILAANSSFISDPIKRKNNLKFYYDNGYKKILKFYNFIETNFLKSKKILLPYLLNSLIKGL